MATTFTRRFDRVFAPFERLLAALTDPARRERAVIAVLFGYVAVWTLYAILAKASQDMHPDVGELVVWSREPAFGYPKHPPLAAWVVRAWTALFPISDWSFYLLATTMPAIALWFAWRLAADYLDAEKRVLGLALLMLVPFFNFHALKFNPNSVLMPLWGATALCFLRSFERRSPGWAALAGACAAAAMLGKYWSIFLLAGLGLAALLDPRRGPYFRSAAPWVTIAVGAVALAPHVVWLFKNDFTPFTYAAYLHVGAESGSLWKTVGYLGGSAGYVVLPVLLALAATRPTRAALRDTLWPETPARRLVAAAFWAPLLLPALVAPLADISLAALWSMSAWALLPVVLLSSPLISLDRRAVLTIVAMAVVLPVVMVAAAPAIAIAIHRGALAPSSAHSSLLAERLLHEWRLVTDKPLLMVGGEGDLTYGVVFYLPGRPSAFPDSRFKMAPWVDPARLRRDGIAIVCGAHNPVCLDRATETGLTGAQIDVDMTRTYRGVAGRSYHYMLIVIPPRP
jgi:4-amino-4-deoxy-L-arabinose transferase-like glycosyltransferase